MVVFIQENKTTDFYFPTMGAWGADVAAHGTLLTAPPDFDQPHDRNSWVHYRMGDYAPPALQVNNDVVIPYYSWLAKTFTFCDHHFGLGSNSTPGHMLAVGGQAPTMKNPPFTGAVPRWNIPSIFSHAQAHGVEWAAFTDDGGYPVTFYESLSTPDAATRIHKASEFVPMAKAGALPPVTYVWSPAGFDEHPPAVSDPAYVSKGEQLVWQRVQAVIDGGGWQDTVFVLTWDDWGGYADSVPTPDVETLPDALHPQGFQALGGSRIPLVMFGGTVRQGIEPQWYSLASIPKTIIDLLGLPPFGVPRVDDAPSLAHRVDPSLTRPLPPVPGTAVVQPAPPVPTPAVVTPDAWPHPPRAMPPLVALDGGTLPAPTDGVVRPTPPPPPRQHGAALPTAANAWAADAAGRAGATVDPEHADYGAVSSSSDRTASEPPPAAGTGVALPGTRREAVGEAIGPVPDDEEAHVTIVLRRRTSLHLVGSFRPLTTEQLGDLHGADAEDVATVVAAVEAAGLRVVESHAPSRRIRVQGPANVLAEWLGTTLSRARLGGVEFRQRTGDLHVPAGLEGVVVAVLGLDDRPQGTPRLAVAEPHAVSQSYTPVQLAGIYGMPAADGTGQTIAIIELGGGFGQADLDTYFTGLGLQVPTVAAVGVDGATNVPGKDPQGADGEVLLDIEVAGAIAPAARIEVYFAPNTDAGFLDAVAQASHASPTPTAISISWGQSEDQWTAQARNAMDAAFADAAALGITVLAAAGDNGSQDRDTSAPGVHTDFPASSPHVLGCGGTTLVATGTKIASETVWQDGPGRGATGGGVSDAFALPAWQAGAGVPTRGQAAVERTAVGEHAAPARRKHKPKPTPSPVPSPAPVPAPPTAGSGRGVPDVAAVADPVTGYEVLVDGQRMVIGGTSAVAPLWAGLVCRVAQLRKKPVGYANPVLYARVAPGASPAGLRDITTGDNGAYRAGPGWDPCTGLGVPAPGIDSLLGGS